MAIATQQGPFTAVDTIPPLRSQQFAAVARDASPYAMWLAPLLVVVALVIPNRFTLRLVGMLPAAAQKFYYFSLFLSPLARRRLLRNYVAYLQHASVVPALGGSITLKKAMERYVPLPYEPDVPQADAPAAVIRLMDGGRVAWVTAAAGLGKSLLAWQVVSRLIADGKVPVVLEGYTLAEKLSVQIANVLRRGGIPIDDATVETLLGTNVFVIILDGYSEVRSPWRDAVADELSAFLDTYAPTRLAVTSRQPPPAGDLSSRTTGIRRAVDDASLESFLLKYLTKRKTVVTTLRNAIVSQLRLQPDEWTPLMLAMITQNYEQKGDVPSYRSRIYHDYFDRLVRQEAIGGLSPAAVKYALERLTRDTFLVRTGERGCTEGEAREVLASLRENLKTYFGVEVPAQEMIEIARGAGILVRSGQYLRFFHDSFESYVAARYLAEVFARREYELVKTVATNRGANAALAEVWVFLEDLIHAESGDVDKLRQLAA